MKEIKSAKKWMSSYDTAEAAIADLEVLLEFFDAGEATEEELDHKLIQRDFEGEIFIL
jgi:peptide chain release factor 2